MTMDCTDVDRFLDHYLDGEFSEADSAALEEHLRACGDCRGLALAEVNIRRGIAEKLNPAPALPEARRESIIEGALAKARGPRWLDLFRPAILVPASAGITLALVAALWFAWPSGGEYDHFIDDSIMAHESELPSEVEGDEAQIADYVREKARFDARPPLKSDDARLVGARLTRVGTTPAVQYRYIVAGRPVTVVQTPAPLAGERARGLEAAVRFVGDRGRHGVGVFEDAGLQNAAVGEMPGKDLLRLVPASY
jgi:anti-sigma factor RsiW